MLYIKEIKQEIENNNPLILNLTNLVTMEIVANSLLALGASPVMSMDKSDALGLTALSQGIMINIGTVNNEFLDIALTTAKHNDKTLPLILDPTGTGASAIRTNACKKLLPYCTGVRGNASEIYSLYTTHRPKGVDSAIAAEDVLTQAKSLSKDAQVTVSISGQNDFIVQNNRQQTCPFGSFLMPKITGMGCALSSVIVAFNTVISDPFEASYFAHLFYGLCGELAYQKDPSLGYFKNNFIDMLHNPDYDYIQKKINSLKDI